MSIQDARPDMGAYMGIPDMGAWQFVIPDGLRQGKFLSEIMMTGGIASASALTGKLGDSISVDGGFGADQT